MDIETDAVHDCAGSADPGHRLSESRLHGGNRLVSRVAIHKKHVGGRTAIMPRRDVAHGAVLYAQAAKKADDFR